MRIDANQLSAQISEGHSTTEAGAQGARKPGNTGFVMQDQAEFSGEHLKIGALATQAAQIPDVRQERVQALRQAVESGNYHPAPEKVAGALLAHMTMQAAG